MKSSKHLLIVLFSALSFSFLFLESVPGINVLLFDLVVLISAAILYSETLFSKWRLITAAALLINSAAFVIGANGWTLFFHFLLFTLHVGVLMKPEVKSLLTSYRLSAFNLLFGWLRFLSDVRKPEIIRVKGVSRVLRYGYLALPVLVVFVFIIMYRNSNPVFDGYVADLSFGLGQFLSNLFSGFHWQWFATLILGLVISIYALVHNIPQSIVEEDVRSSDVLIRFRNMRSAASGMLGLKHEWLAGIVLLVMLNILIFIVNSIDIYWVWFNFEWEGEYLKQFVHEGTYLLILSILISIAIVLYFFRNNQNFYSKSLWLKRLCYVWLFQNAILAISVGVRNLHYINNFALASKRIGVMFFLLMVILGIVTVYLKVRHRKSSFFLFKWNVLSVILILFVSSLPNWNSTIARYNFAHHQTAFLHLDYLSTFDFESIPYIDYSLQDLQAMESIQKEKFPFEEEYMTAEQYHHLIQDKKNAFRVSMEDATWQEWTLARQRTIDYLNSNPDT